MAVRIIREFKLERGLNQREVLSSLLQNIFYNSLLETLEKAGVEVNIEYKGEIVITVYRAVTDNLTLIVTYKNYVT